MVLKFNTDTLFITLHLSPSLTINSATHRAIKESPKSDIGQFTMYFVAFRLERAADYPKFFANQVSKS
jgi:hypothetical protein